MLKNRIPISAATAVCVIVSLGMLGACDSATEPFEETYPDDTYFALALTDASWTAHDIAPVVKLDFGGTVQPATVAAVRVLDPPVIDGQTGDDAWGEAEASVLVLEPVNGGCGIDVASVKCVYDTEGVYFLVSWLDPSSTKSDDPGRWVLDNDQWFNTYDENGNPDAEGEPPPEDKLAFFWMIADTYPEFPDEGCTATCHGGARHATAGSRLLDVWFWGAGRTNPRQQCNDSYLSPAGFILDPGRGSAQLNRSTEGLPLFQHQSDPNANASYLLAEEAVAFQPDAEWLEGGEIPGYVLHQTTDSSADVSAAGGYGGGSWSVELFRAYYTGHPEHDVTFTWDIEGDGGQ
ncbi:MAG: hypothetical protein GF399_11035 [Candidatus Coatesbacteria bacterium]|nr:hypothetical protein [Candidatus Coatesbacteria bacterium]